MNAGSGGHRFHHEGGGGGGQVCQIKNSGPRFEAFDWLLKGENRICLQGGPTAKGEVVVPRASVGMIIGKGGEMIKRLAQETGTKIQFKPDGRYLNIWKRKIYFFEGPKLLRVLKENITRNLSKNMWFVEFQKREHWISLYSGNWI